MGDVQTEEEKWETKRRAEVEECEESGRSVEAMWAAVPPHDRHKREHRE